MQVALITGVSSGIGRATARKLAQLGYRTFGTVRSEIDPIPNVQLIRLDVRDSDSINAGIAAVIEKAGRIDVLVNNAGVSLVRAAEDTTIEEAREIFETNFFGLMRITQAVLPVMRKQNSGRIINISSVLGFIPAPYMSVYAATKHAIEGYSESVDHEVREYGIRVLLVEPAYTRTSFDANAILADEPLPLYERRREVQDVVLAEAIKGGDEPSVVGEAIVAAATDARPKLRYPAGPLARRVSKLRRYAPSTMFDKQIRKINQLNGPASSSVP